MISKFQDPLISFLYLLDLNWLKQHVSQGMLSCHIRHSQVVIGRVMSVMAPYSRETTMVSELSTVTKRK